MIIPASTKQKAIGALMVAASLVYLTHFVARGWIPHDEGMLGQSAERVLQGQIPHVDYEEPYTGGLSWIYAAVFRIAGVELLYIRWLLFGVATVAVCLLYSLLRRFLLPTSAALGTWVGLAWSFPNYFAGLPSWWLLTCSLACLWAIVRYEETGDVRYGLLAGITAGIAVAIKQTGTYLLIAAVLTTVYAASIPVVSRNTRRLIGGAAALGSGGLATVLLWPRLFAAEGVYLWLPIVTCSAALLLRKDGDRPGAWALLSAVGAAALVPIVILLMPYVKHEAVPQFAYGAFVLPRKRLAFASLPMPPAAAIITTIPLVGFLMPDHARIPRLLHRIVNVLIWTAAVALPIAALFHPFPYQLIWQSTRGAAVLVPIAICYLLISGHVQETRHAVVLFACATILAWTALNQFPYAGPIYFLYTTPLVVIAAAALGSTTGLLHRRALVAWTMMMLIFALVSMHRSYVRELGFQNVPRYFDTQLDLPRAHLFVERYDATLYEKTVDLVHQHLGTGLLIAGPDMPELYYLAGAPNKAGRLFDFFSVSDSDLIGTAQEWMRGQVIVINHRPPFSEAPGPQLMAILRRHFPAGKEIGPYEVRWR